MQINQKKQTARGAFGVCTLSALYVVLVTLIPIMGFGAKGTSTNTILKAAIFIIYIGALFLLAKFKMVIGGGRVYILLAYLFSQALCFTYSQYSVAMIDIVNQAAILFALFLLLPKTRGQKRDIVNGIKILVLFDIAAIIYNFFLHFDRFISLSFLTNVYYDMYSFFDNKNTYGMILFVTLVLLFYWRSICDTEDAKTKKRINKMIYVQLFAIAVSMCRTALVCTIIFLLCDYLRDLSARRLLTAIGLGFAFAIVYSIPSVKEYLLYILFRVDVDTYREPIVEASLELVRENPLFGCGQGSWGETLAKISRNAYSHNGFLSVLMNGGMIYFSAYVVIIIRALSSAIRIRKINRNLGSQVFIFVLAVVVYAFFEATVLCEVNASNFAFTIGAIILPQLYLNMSTCSEEEHPKLIR